MRPSVAKVFQSTDGQHLERMLIKVNDQGGKVWPYQALLMAKPVEAGVLEVFDIDRRHLVHCRVPLLPQAEQVGIRTLSNVID